MAAFTAMLPSLSSSYYFASLAFRGRGAKGPDDSLGGVRKRMGVLCCKI